jgi:phage terminase small subunit
MRRPGHPSTNYPNLPYPSVSLRPPSDLDADAKAVFAALVAEAKEGHFQGVDEPVLAAYARAVCIERQTASLIRANPLGATASLIKSYEAATRTIYTLSQRLRCCPMSRAPNASRRDKPGRDGPVSYYEHMAAMTRGNDAKG